MNVKIPAWLASEPLLKDLVREPSAGSDLITRDGVPRPAIVLRTGGGRFMLAHYQPETRGVAVVTVTSMADIRRAARAVGVAADLGIDP